MTVQEMIKQRNLKWYHYVGVAGYVGMVCKIPNDLLWLEVKNIGVNVGVFVTITYLEI